MINLKELKKGDMLVYIGNKEKKRRLKLNKTVEKSYGTDYHFEWESEYMKNDFTGSLILVEDQIIFNYQIWTQMELNLKPREGWENRNVTPLPTEKCVLFVIKKDVDGEHIFLCEWQPYKPKPDYFVYPEEGYIGSVTVISGKHEGIGFHAWEQNNDEFLYYKLVEYPKL